MFSINCFLYKKIDEKNNLNNKIECLVLLLSVYIKKSMFLYKK
jgi:hypothetical protein